MSCRKPTPVLGQHGCLCACRGVCNARIPAVFSALHMRAPARPLPACVVLLVCLCREMEAAAKRAVAQQELLNGRIAELDAEGRKLRDQKYQLDSQV